MLVITITYERVMAALALFTAACVAGGWLLKIIKGLKKPAEDVKGRLDSQDEKLDNDNKRIKKLEDDIDYIKKTQSQLLQVCLVILDELKKNNDVDGVIEKTEKQVQSFLINR